MPKRKRDRPKRKKGKKSTTYKTKRTKTKKKNGRRIIKVSKRGGKSVAKRKIVKRIRRKIKGPYPKKFLRNVSPEYSLWIINGVIVKSLRELLKELKKMNDDVFRYHVNKERNDFYKWVKEVIGDIPLSRDVKKARNKHKVIKLITKSIKG